MPDLELDLESAIEAVQSTASEKSGDCGCGGKSSFAEADPFESADTFAADDLGGQLDSALAEVEMSADTLSVDEELAFAALGDATGVSLSDIATLVEKYPGLKITFSG
ncbi:MAG: hypothetical protein ACXWID_10095 [Pyrinomonadaceae bacterium]